MILSYINLYSRLDTTVCNNHISSISNIWLDIEDARQPKKWWHHKDHCSNAGLLYGQDFDFQISKAATDALLEKSKHGGGALRGISSKDVRGGNAINIAYGLAKLGAQVRLFTIADEIGSIMLNRIFSKFGNNVDLRIVRGMHGRTTALEFVGKKPA
jgi:hypothetical protein